MDEADRAYLQRAVELAEAGRGCTNPNPVVGALVVRQGQVLGEGYHAGPGLDHAEIVALKQAVDARGATVYVTLEPCCVYGRTPPCTKSLVEAKVARVVVGAIDPYPHVHGQGIAELQAAGIQVDVADGDIALRCRRQNNGFRKAMMTKLPFVTYKYAMTLDGRVATDNGDARWVSGPESRALVHHMRALADAVVVGAGTLRADDPLLTAREVGCSRQPLRVVVDGLLSISKTAALIASKDEGPVLVVCYDDAPCERQAEVQSWGVETAAVAGHDRECLTEGWVSPRAVAALLGARGVQSVLLEGGPTLAGSWWSAGLIDEVVAFIAPRLLSGAVSRSPLQGAGVPDMAQAMPLREVRVRAVGADLCISGYVTEAY